MPTPKTPRAPRPRPEDLDPGLFSAAHAIRKARLADGLSQNELARRAGVAPSIVSRIESGVIERPGVRTLEQLAQALGRSAWLLSAIQDEYAQTFYTEDWVDLPILRKARAAHEREMENEVPDDAAVHERYERPVFEALIEYWVEHRATDVAVVKKAEQADPVSK